MKQCHVFIMDEFMHIETNTKGDYSCDNIYDSSEYLQQIERAKKKPANAIREHYTRIENQRQAERLRAESG